MPRKNGRYFQMYFLQRKYFDIDFIEYILKDQVGNIQAFV